MRSLASIQAAAERAHGKREIPSPPPFVALLRSVAPVSLNGEEGVVLVLVFRWVCLSPLTLRRSRTPVATLLEKKAEDARGDQKFPPPLQCTVCGSVAYGRSEDKSFSIKRMREGKAREDVFVPPPTPSPSKGTLTRR